MNRGFTFYICFGKYAGFRITKSRILLGCMSIAYVKFDIEVTIEKLIDKLEKK